MNLSTSEALAVGGGFGGLCGRGTGSRARRVRVVFAAPLVEEPVTGETAVGTGAKPEGTLLERGRFLARESLDPFVDQPGTVG
jgi:hypothetical protein